MNNKQSQQVYGFLPVKDSSIVPPLYGTAVRPTPQKQNRSPPDNFLHSSKLLNKTKINNFIVYAPPNMVRPIRNGDNGTTHYRGFQMQHRGDVGVAEASFQTNHIGSRPGSDLGMCKF
jgi:hypothetical protein